MSSIIALKSISGTLQGIGELSGKLSLPMITYEIDYNEGYEAGYNLGYSEGYEAAVEETSSLHIVTSDEFNEVSLESYSEGDLLVITSATEDTANTLNVDFSEYDAGELLLVVVK